MSAEPPAPARARHTIRETIDCFIATFCIQNNYRLLGHNREFDSFERELGPEVVHPGGRPTGVH